MTDKQQTNDKEGLEFAHTQLRKTHRAEDISEIVRQGILNGYWKPDDKINDQELSERLGVSRLTVRDALSKLVERGIVDNKYWKGYIVHRLNWQEIESIIDVRIALEEIALRKIMELLTPEIIVDLDKCIKTCEEKLTSHSFDEFFDWDYGHLFHKILYRGSGNTIIPQIMENLNFQITVIRLLEVSKKSERDEENIRAHRSIFSRIKKGDTEKAVDLLRKHLYKHKDRVRAEYMSIYGEQTE